MMSWPLLYRMVCKDLLSDYTRICAAAAMPHNTSMIGIMWEHTGTGVYQTAAVLVMLV